MSRFPDPPPSPKRSGFQIGRLLAGLVIVVFGIGWLLETLGAAIVPWRVVLPTALILIGFALVLSARSGREHGGLITLGILLTVVLAVGTVVNVPVRGGVGQRSERPNSYTELQGQYNLAVGQLTLDLTELPVPVPSSLAHRSVRVRVGVGQLVVVVPRAMLVDVWAHAGLGRVSVFGRERSGFDATGGFLPFVPSEGMTIVLDVSVGIGDVEVRYG